MYSGSQYSNNPFIDGTTQTQERYPDINTIDRATGPSYNTYGSNGGYASGYDAAGAGVSGYGYGQQQQQPSPSYGQLQAQPYGGWNASTSGYATYAASVSPQMTGMPYPQQQPQSLSYNPQQPTQGYASAAPQLPYSGGYAVQGQGQGYGGGMGMHQMQMGAQQTPTPSFLAEFDPYANANNAGPGAGAAGTNQSQYGRPASSQSGREHPRDYIRLHRRELDIWDAVSWKQAVNSFESLKGAWEERKNAIDAQLRQGGYYMHPQEQQHVNNLLKEATEHIDTIAASSLQMQEVYSGYRHSSDLASKNRVRSSLNAALQSLPDWPQS